MFPEPELQPVEDHTSMAEESEDQASFRIWCQSSKAFDLLKNPLLKHAERKMRPYHMQTTGEYNQEAGEPPCGDCSNRTLNPCEECETWKRCVGNAVRHYTMEWCGRSFQQSFEDWNRFAVLFMGKSYQKLEKVEDADAYGLVMLMKQCKAFEFTNEDNGFMNTDYERVCSAKHHGEY